MKFVDAHQTACLVMLPKVDTSITPPGKQDLRTKAALHPWRNLATQAEI
jgi:hypothetical protein